MLKRNHQAGVTLVEMLISMALSLIAVTAAVLLMTKFARSTGAYTEAAYLEEQRSSFEGLIRADMDGAGFNLTRPTAPFPGKENVTFLNSPDFSSTAGSILKLNNNSAVAYGAHAVSSGISLWSWTPTTVCRFCSAGIQGSDGQYDTINTYADGSPNPGAVYIFESRSGYVASNAGLGLSIPAHIAGDSYQIGVEAPNQQQQTRFVRYYRIRAGVRTILYTSQNPAPAAPQYMFASINNAGESINSISVIGAPIQSRTDNQTEFAHLPFDGGTQLTGPVTITGGGSSITLLSGDKNTDASQTTTAFASSNTDLNIKTPVRGSYAVGDVALIVDYGSTDPANPVSPASAVCVVSGVATVDSQTTKLTLTRATQTTPAFSRLWSSAADQAHTYAAGSATVVKLAPPVTYAVSTDSRLVRIEGARASTIAFNVRGGTAAQTGTAPTISYTVTVTFAAEGFETANTTADETRATVEFVSTPRALNLASNQLN